MDFNIHVSKPVRQMCIRSLKVYLSQTLAVLLFGYTFVPPQR